MKAKLLFTSLILILVSNITFAVRFYYVNHTTRHYLMFVMNWLEHNPTEFRTKIVSPNSETEFIITTDPRWKSIAANAKIQFSVYVIPEDGSEPYPACGGEFNFIFTLPANARHLSHGHVGVDDYICSRSVGYSSSIISGLQYMQEILPR